MRTALVKKPRFYPRVHRVLGQKSYVHPDSQHTEVQKHVNVPAPNRGDPSGQSSSPSMIKEAIVGAAMQIEEQWNEFKEDVGTVATWVDEGWDAAAGAMAEYYMESNLGSGGP